MYRQLIINPRYRPVFTDDCVMMLDETTFSVLSGNLVVRVLETIQSSGFSKTKLLEEVSEEEIQEVSSLLEHLIEDRFIIEKPESEIPGLGVWDRIGLHAEQLDRSLLSTTIALRVISDALSDEFIATSLQQVGLQIENDGDLEVVVTDHPKSPVLCAIDVKNWLIDKPWMLVCLNGTRPWIGPIFHRKTACYHCLQDRLCESRPGELFAEEHLSEKDLYSSLVEIAPPLRDIALNMAAVEIMRWVTKEKNKRIEGAIMEMDVSTWQSSFHQVPKRAACPMCSQDTSNLDCTRTFLKNESPNQGFRLWSSEKVWQNLKHLVSPVTGIVRELRRYYPASEMETPFYIYGARHSLVHSVDSLDKLKASVHHSSTGKGKTILDAQVSALCEAVERYSGLWKDPVFTVSATLNELGSDAISADRLLGYSQNQYEQRIDLNAKMLSTTEYIPRKLDASETIAWTPIWSITHHRVRWVPTAYLYYDYPCHSEPYCFADSNGNAAGASLQEAVLQGLFELLERDAVAIWWYNKVSRPGVDLHSLNDPYVEDLLEFYHTRHRDIWVLDLTHDLNVPTFAALSRRNDRQPEDIIFGASCHVDPRRAILGALSELNQLFSNVAEEGENGTNYRMKGQGSLKWFQKVRVDEFDYLQPAGSLVSFNTLQKRYTFANNTSQDLKTLLDVLCRSSFDVLVHNQTQQHIGLSVAKTIVPGLNHWWRRLGNERLFRVPVDMGWLQKTKSEKEMNPFSILW